MGPGKECELSRQPLLDEEALQERKRCGVLARGLKSCKKQGPKAPCNAMPKSEMCVCVWGGWGSGDMLYQLTQVA